MKRIKVIRISDGKETHRGEGQAADVDAWRDYCLSINKFGKPERWVTSEMEDISAAIETRQVDVDGQVVIEYKLAAQFSIVEEDITAEVAAQKAKADARKAAIARLESLNLAAKLGPAITVAQIKTVLQEIIQDILLSR